MSNPIIYPLIFLMSAFSLALASDAPPGPECRSYLKQKGYTSPHELADFLPKCAPDSEDLMNAYAPNPKPNIQGATNTEALACHYGGHPSMNGVCCGWKPHFNWVVATCEPSEQLQTTNFCKGLPECVKSGSPKINYVAAYQYNGSHFILIDESTAGEVSAHGVSGNYHNRTGWEAIKSNFSWKGGDWNTKYAPWGSRSSGPRGLTPPGMLWLLSAEHFYYGAFYMLSQLTLNLEGHDNPTGNNCWMWELDAIEGTRGWVPDGKPLPGSLNELYATNNAQVSACMPVTYTAFQANGGKRNISVPREFLSYCNSNPDAVGCRPWTAPDAGIWWSGGAMGSQRFENLWDEAYVFAVVADRQGYWIYRWRPETAGNNTGATGWPGVFRHSASRVLSARPRPVTDPRGLVTDVSGDVPEAVILQPSVLPEAACLRSSLEAVNNQFGATALGAIATELGENAQQGTLAGAQNWWAHFADTDQNSAYPLSIAGKPILDDTTKPRNCTTPETFACNCKRET